MKNAEKIVVYHSGLELNKEVKVLNKKQASNMILYSILELFLVVLTAYGMVMGFVYSFDLQLNDKLFWFVFLGATVLFSPVFFYNRCKTYLFLFVNIGYFSLLYIYFEEFKNGMILILERVLAEINQYYGTRLMIFWDVKYGVDLAKGQTVCILFFLVLTIQLLLFVILFKRCKWIYLMLSIFYIGLPFAVGIVPPFYCLMMYVIGTIALLNSKYNVHKDVSGKVRVILAVMVACLLMGIRLAIPHEKYEEIFPVGSLKIELQNNVQRVLSDINLKKIIQGDLFSYGKDSTGGIGYGKIGKTDVLSFQKKTALQLEVPKEYKRNIVFLRSYVGEVYKDNEWNSLGKTDLNVYYELVKLYGDHFQNLLGRLVPISNLYLNQNVDTVRIINIDAGKKNQFIPYGAREEVSLSKTGSLFVQGVEDKQEYTMEYYGQQSIELINRLNGTYEGEDEFILRIDEMKMLPFYSGKISRNTSEAIDYLSEEMAYRTFVYDAYTRLPQNDAIETVRRFQEYKEYVKDAYQDELNLNLGTPMTQRIKELSQKITLAKMFLFQQVEYSLSPGATPKGKDAIDYFVCESRRGYCGHYASAGVILLRSMGIPARYVEGYVVTNNDYIVSSIVKGKRVLDVQDTNAHAWVEVYVDYIGWVPIEMTEGYSYQESGMTLPIEIENMVMQQANTNIKSTPIPVSTPEPTLEPNLEPSKKPDSVELIQKESSFVLSAKAKRVLMLFFFCMIMVITIISMIWIRYMILMKRKKKRLENKNSNKRVISFYQEIEKMAFYKAHISLKSKLEESIDQVRDALFYVELEKWDRLIFIANKASFSQRIVSEKELTYVEELYQYIQKKFYYRSHFILMLYYKYIKIF